MDRDSHWLQFCKYMDLFNSFKCIYKVITMIYNLFYEFEWDQDKASRNFDKHGIRFFMATAIWSDVGAFELLDPDSPEEEDRWIRIGRSSDGVVLVVVFCEREQRIRLLSARKAEVREELEYYTRLK